MNITFILILLAFICAALATIGVNARINLIALALAFYFLSHLISV